MPTCGKGHQVHLITVEQEMKGVMDGVGCTGFGYETSKTSLQKGLVAIEHGKIDADIDGQQSIN